jgi:hypothetical protein
VSHGAGFFGPLTRLQCCPPTCGAAAAIVVSESFARSRGLDAGVAIAAQAMTTDTPASFDGDLMRLVGYDMTASAEFIADGDNTYGGRVVTDRPAACCASRPMLY